MPMHLYTLRLDDNNTVRRAVAYVNFKARRRLEKMYACRLPPLLSHMHAPAILLWIASLVAHLDSQILTPILFIANK